MAEVKKKTDAWELHNILTGFDTDKNVDSGYSEPIDEKMSQNSTMAASQGFQTALTLHKNQETQNDKGTCIIIVKLVMAINVFQLKSYFYLI